MNLASSQRISHSSVNLADTIPICNDNENFSDSAIATAYKIAEIKGLPPAEVLRATYNNTRRVYQLPLF